LVLTMQRSLAVAVFSLGLPVVAWMAWRWSPFPRAPHPQVRSIEPRLTGITSYAPCEPQSDPERVISRIRCAGFPELGALEPREVEPADDERDEKETSRGLSAVDLRRNALAALSDPRGLGSIEMAVRSLEGATRADPGNAGNWSNLSAARFVLAQQLDDPSELIRALEAAQKAWQLDPALPESRFNRALILTMIPLRDQAITSWNDYLEIDDSSGWADEAREHLAALREPPTPELWSAQVPAALRAAALGNHAAQVRQIVDLSHQDARVHAQEDLLGDWGERVLAGQPAEEPLTVARAIGQVLAAAGDSSVALAVHFIDEQAGVPGVLATLARGHRAYREASRDLRNLFVERSIPGWSEALESFTAARSPMALWAEMGEAGVAIHQARGEEAWPRLQSIASQAHETGQIALEGRADWSLGLIRVRQGRYSESLSRYREAAGLFERIGELENLGAVRELIAENLTFLGQTAAGWQERYQAISLLFRYPSSIRLHNALWEGRTAALLDGELEAALLLQTEDLGVAERSGDPGMVAEALLRRSEIHLALGNTAQALQDLDDARRSNDRFEDREVREKLAADIVSAEGKLQSLGNPDQARASFSEALTYYEDKHLALQLIEAYLGRARACFALGEDEAGEADLQAALQVFEEQRSSVTDDGSRLSFSEAVQGLFDEMISLQARHGRSEAALAFSDRARTVPLARRAAHAELLADLLKKIPANLVLVEYAVMRDRLMIWVVRRGHIGLTSRTLQPGDLERRVGRFLSALRRGDGIAKIQEASAALHDILIPEELRGLPESVELCFVPDKILNAVPFAALWDRGQGRYLIETHPVATTPSIALSLEASARDRSGAGDAPPSALLVGATVYDQRLFSGLRRLPGAEAEIQGIRPLYPDAVVITGEEATRARVLDALGDREILHFSGHGVYNPRNPDHSYLVVASAQEPPDSGMLFAREIAGRNLERLRLVVLSACDTLGPRDSRTGGLSGIARPFLDAGVPAVLGTLWSAKDRASAALMPEFHRQFVRTGNVSLALREAQLEMLWGGEDELRSPAYWGAFEVVGGAL
jgi:CHAT domain-containing protein